MQYLYNSKQNRMFCKLDGYLLFFVYEMAETRKIFCEISHCSIRLVRVTIVYFSKINVNVNFLIYCKKL